MDDKLTLQIDKLGHELEEIRVRALTSIISKLDLGILSERDLIKNNDLFSKLLKWFEFPAVPCKKDVLKLITRLTQEEDGCFYLEVSDPGLERLQAHVGSEFPEELAAVRQNIQEHLTSSQPASLLMYDEQQNSDIQSHSTHIQTISTNHSRRSEEWEYNEVYWPVPRLDESDARVLKSVAELLTDRTQYSQVANFFSSVLLHDFPPQVFLQDTSILNALFKLYKEEGDNQIILTCFKEFTTSLQRQYKIYEDTASIETVCHVSKDEDELALCESVGQPIEQLGVGEYCALSLERLGHHLPSALTLLRLTIRDPVAFWEAVSGAFLKSSITNHLLALVTKIKAISVHDPVGRLEMLVWLSRVLTTLVPLSVSSTVVPKQLQSLLLQLLFDPCLALLYPKVHKVFKEYIGSFQYLDMSEFKMVEELGESLKSAGRLRKGQVPPSETLHLFQSSISSFDIHQDYSLIPVFFNAVSERDLLPSECELAEQILQSLLSHPDETVQEETYSKLASLVSQVLGPSAANSRNILEFERVQCILSLNILKGILYFGITSPLPKVSKSAETIWVLILKAKLILSSENWMKLLTSISSCFPLLQAFTSQESALARAVLQMFDPDVAASLNLHKLQILVGNVRFLFSADRNVNSEGYIRVAYLLGITPGVPFVMPHPSQTLISKTALFTEDNIPRLVEVLRTAEGDLLRSAVVQIGLLSEQPSLHIPLLESGALPLLLHILSSALESKSDQYRDLFASIILVLKNLAFHNMQIRNDFSVDYNIYSLVLQGLFSFPHERRWVSDAFQLLGLMAYSDYIVASDGCLSLPKILSDSLKLPFPTINHSVIPSYIIQTQKHAVASNKEACVYLGSVWCSALGEGPAALLTNPSPPPFPLKLPSSKSILHLPSACSNSLIDLRTASNHQLAMDALTLISRYLSLSEYTTDDLEHLAWKESFCRYLMTVPASPADQILLIEILRVLSQLICKFHGQVSWISSFLRDPSKMPCTLLTQTTVEDCTSVRKELSLELLGLVEQCIRLEDDESWAYVSTILLQSLHHSHTQKFYTLAVIEGLLRCLLVLSGKLAVPADEGPLWKLLAAFHCPSNTSFMGLTITRRLLFTLNSIIARATEVKVCEEVAWLWKVLSSRDWLVVGAALELISRLCSVPRNLPVLLHHLPDLWDFALGLILDQRQSCLVREQATYLCCNIVMHSQNKNYVLDILEKDVFDIFSSIYVRHKRTKKPEEIFTYHSAPFQDVSDDFYYSGASTKKMVTYICCFVMALMMKDNQKMVAAASKSGFILTLARDLTEWRCERITEKETVGMFEAVLRLLVHSYSPTSSGFYSGEALQTLIWLLLPSTYVGGLEVEELLVQSLRLLSLLASGESEQNLVLPGEAVSVISNAVRTPDPALSSAAVAVVTVLAPVFSQRGCLELIEAMGTQDNARPAVGSVVGNSECATLAGLELGLLPDALSRLARLQLALALTPRNTKKSMCLLESVNLELCVLTNLLAGCGTAKEQAALLGLADYIHKLWAWTVTDFNLLSTLLRTLITFTADCPQAAGTLVLTSTLAGVGQRKTPTSLSILHAILSSLLKEVFPSKIKILFLEVISHAIQATEARIIIAKSNFLSEFLSVFSQKKSGSVDALEFAWLDVLTVFTSYSDGQSAVVKNEEVVEKLVDYLSGSRGNKHRGPALAIIRNIAFNQTFRRRFLISSDHVLVSIGDRLGDLTLPDEELSDILVLVWTLSANSQRGKAAVRASGLSTRLEAVLGLRKRPQPISDLVDILIPLLQA